MELYSQGTYRRTVEIKTSGYQSLSNFENLLTEGFFVWLCPHAHCRKFEIVLKAPYDLIKKGAAPGPVGRWYFSWVASLYRKRKGTIHYISFLLYFH